MPLGGFSQVAKDMFQSDESRWRTSSIQRARESGERERERMRMENENEREIETVRQSDSQTVRVRVGPGIQES